MRRRQVTAGARSAARSWCSTWEAQSTGRCTTCRNKRPVMLIEDSAHVCAECHELRLRQWRLDDMEAERQEVLWDAWDHATRSGRP